MIPEEKAIKDRHDKFIAEITQGGVVWALSSDEGFATVTSDEYSDEDGEPIEMICFWSNQEAALACAKAEWSAYETEEIDLPAFLENWCVGMHNEGLLVGTSFDWDLFGYEIEALDLILEIAEAMRAAGKDLPLEKYESLAALEAEARAVIDEE